MVTIVRDRIQDLIKKGQTLAQIRKADPVKGYRAPLRRRHAGRGRPTSSSRRSTRASEASSADPGLDSPWGCGALRRGIDVLEPVGAGAGAPPGPPPTGKAGAPIDLTGYWVSVITEDWRWRMVTPPKGDYASLPINMDAKKAADAWDPAKDEAAGEACKAYGAPGLMRLPGRLHITWQDDNTMKVETDAGTQTRLFHFGDWKAPGGAPTRAGRHDGAVGNRRARPRRRTSRRRCSATSRR